MRNNVEPLLDRGSELGIDLEDCLVCARVGGRELRACPLGVCLSP